MKRACATTGPYHLAFLPILPPSSLLTILLFSSSRRAKLRHAFSTTTKLTESFLLRACLFIREVHLVRRESSSLVATLLAADELAFAEDNFALDAPACAEPALAPSAEVGDDVLAEELVVLPPRHAALPRAERRIFLIVTKKTESVADHMCVRREWAVQDARALTRSVGTAVKPVVFFHKRSMS
jgi:hypothetical protein